MPTLCRMVQRGDRDPEEVDISLGLTDIKHGALYTALAGGLPHASCRRVPVRCPGGQEYDVPNDQGGWYMIRGMRDDDVLVVHPLPSDGAGITPPRLAARKSFLLPTAGPRKSFLLPTANHSMAADRIEHGDHTHEARHDHRTPHFHRRDEDAIAPANMTHKDPEVPEGFCAPCCQGYVYCKHHRDISLALSLPAHGQC